MNDNITTSMDAATEQRGATASVDLAEATSRLDEQFAEGFAKSHPTLADLTKLVSALGQVGAITAQQMRDGFAKLAPMKYLLERIVEEVHFLSDYVSDRLDPMIDAIYESHTGQ